MEHNPDQLVKTCRKLESGIRLGQEGIHACQVGPFSSPIYWSFEEAEGLKITREMIIAKRQELFERLNTEGCDIACKSCQMLITKRYREVDLTKLGHIDLASSTICNLRCSFCAYTVDDWFKDAKYDALAILREFAPEDVLWDSAVDFNGGEPTLYKHFDDYISYFSSRRIRVFLYTNAVQFSQSVFDALKSGAIRWVCTSLDCGSAESFLRMKQRDRFHEVLETLKRYAIAGSQGGGSLAVKYIFCENNCGDEDVIGFVEAMRAVRPQKIWLTFDFEPLKGLPGDSEDFGDLDYSKHIAAYARMYLLLEQHGLETEHFAKRHLAVVSRHGKALLERALAEIERRRPQNPPSKTMIAHIPAPNLDLTQVTTFTTRPLRIQRPGQAPETWPLDGKRVAIAPACAAAIELLSIPELGSAKVVAFFDRDQVLHGKTIEGIPIHGYDQITEVAPDVILVAPPETHQNTIFQTVLERAASSSSAVLLKCP